MTSLATALVEAQKKMPVVHKTAKANYGNYATLDAIIEKTRPVLNDHGLAISQFPAELLHGGPGLKTVLLHAESGESIEATVPLLLNGKNDMQALGGAITYARRYGWAAVLGIANDEDDDGDAVSAPRSGANQVSVPPGQGGSGGSGAVTDPPSTDSPASPSFEAPVKATGSAATLAWKYGPHAGMSIAETPLDFVVEYAANKTGFMADKCKEFLAENGGSVDEDPDSSIPF